MNPSRIFPRASLSIITSTLTCNLHVSILISIQFRVRILCRLVHWYPPNGNCGCTACPRASWHVAEGKAIAERERLNAEIAATKTLVQRYSTYVLSSVAQPSEVKCRLMGWSHRRKRRMTCEWRRQWTKAQSAMSVWNYPKWIDEEGRSIALGEKMEDGLRASGEMSPVSRYLIEKAYAMYDKKHGTVPRLITHFYATSNARTDSSEKKQVDNVGSNESCSISLL